MTCAYRYLLYAVLTTFLFCNNAVAQGWEWAKRATGDGYVSGTAVAADRFGGIYSLYDTYSGGVRFDSIDIHANANGCDGATLIRHDASGNVKWARAINRNCKRGWYMGVVALATDNRGNVYVTGGYNSDSLLLGSKSLIRDTSRGGSDMFVVKYDSTGNVIWATVTDASGRSADPNSISVDSAGNAYVSGNYYESGPLSFGGVFLNFNGDDGQMFLVKYDSTGKAAWARKADYTSFPSSQCSAVDSKGNIYVAGDFRTPSLSFSGVTVSNTADTPNYYSQATDVFLAKFSPDNHVLWVKCAGSSFRSSNFPRTLTVDKDDNVLMAGASYSDSIVFDHEILVINTPRGSSNMFLAKYDSAGNVKWARGARGKNLPTSVTTDDTGNVYAVGYYSMPVTFGPTVLPIDSPDMSTRFMMVKYDAAGDVKWARASRSSGCVGWGITCDRLNNLYVTGSYDRHNLLLDTLTLIRERNGTAFLAKLNPYLHFIDVADPVVPGPPSDPDVPLLYPNPTADMLTIAWGDTIRSVSIRNVLGQRLINVDCQLTEVVIDITGIAPGVYYASINNSRVIAFVKKQKP